MKNKQFLLRLPVELYAELVAEAKARGLTVSAMTRVILLDALRKRFSERLKK